MSKQTETRARQPIPADELKDIAKAYEKSQQGSMDPNALVIESDLEVLKEDDEEGLTLTTLFMSLAEVSAGGGMEQSRAILTQIMPADREGASELTARIRRACLAMEQLRNLAMELLVQRT